MKTLTTTPNATDELLKEVARTLPLGRESARNTRRPLSLEHVAAVGQPFLAAAISRAGAAASQHVWIICRTEREQERFYGEISAWIENVLMFPHSEVAAVEGALPDPEVVAERLSVLAKLSTDESGAQVIVLTAASLDDAVYSPAELRKLTIHLRVGEQLEREAFLDRLVQAGYQSVHQVGERGQFSTRGGIVDVYSWQLLQPVRIEWFDDEISSIREFDADRQTSTRQLDECAFLLHLPTSSDYKLRRFQKNSDLVVSVEDTVEGANVLLRSAPTESSTEETENHEFALYESPLSLNSHLGDSITRHLREERVQEQLKDWFKDGYTVCVRFRKQSEKKQVEELTKHYTTKASKVLLVQSSGDASFVYPAARVAIATTAQLFSYAAERTPLPAIATRNRRGVPRQITGLDYTDLKVGDLVVHLEHGLARYRGTEARRSTPLPTTNTAARTEEFMVLEFAEQARLFVPLEQAFLVSRYVGIGRRGAVLSKLGDGKWSATKKTAEKSIYDYAAKLLETQAVRDSGEGKMFRADTPWQREFEDAFPYKETADQLRAIADTKRDMESGRAMDRLICGDVGFGKTEVAIRAAFKAVNDGVQVAMMVPTTVLAQQHYENFKARMANYPVTVELLSRYRTPAEQAQVARGLADGSVDLVIGTHRLISKDVHFKQLGLLIVDEEQRFGVRHKERIKERFPAVDVLTLSATPIPRTLYLALTGARDLSTLETPPPSRFPIETLICAYDERVIRAAIDRELDRQGQVYFLHNRVESIAKVCARVRQLCPRARTDVGHGQMEEGELEEVMHRFVRGETDVLVATTIIESGLDIPNANTIIIDRADRFGLADLYQLRGRVGRGQHKAYAYLMLPREMMTVGEARKRINAIKQYSSLGAGFKIALRDLEIRGAGNILGVAQSGHLTAIGFDLYCQLLRQAVDTLRGEKVTTRLSVVLRLDFVAASETEYERARTLHAQAAETDDAQTLPLAAAGLNETSPVQPWPAYLPAGYIEDAGLRVQAYRQLAAVVTAPDVDALQKEWRDRFGPLPEAADNLLTLSRLKIAAAKGRVEQLEVRGDKVMITRGGQYVQYGGKFPRLTSQEPADKMREIFDLLERQRPVFSGATNSRERSVPAN